MAIQRDGFVMEKRQALVGVRDHLLLVVPWNHHALFIIFFASSFLSEMFSTIARCVIRKEQAMYASIRKYYIIPGTLEELLRRVQEGFVPLISQIPGFRAYYVLEVRNDEVLSISIFDTQAGAEESVRRSADWVAKDLASFLQGLPEIIVGQVRVQSGLMSFQ